MGDRHARLASRSPEVLTGDLPLTIAHLRVHPNKSPFDRYAARLDALGRSALDLAASADVDSPEMVDVLAGIPGARLAERLEKKGHRVRVRATNR